MKNFWCIVFLLIVAFNTTAQTVSDQIMQAKINERATLSNQREKQLAKTTEINSNIINDSTFLIMQRDSIKLIQDKLTQIENEKKNAAAKAREEKNKFGKFQFSIDSAKKANEKLKATVSSLQEKQKGVEAQEKQYDSVSKQISDFRESNSKLETSISETGKKAVEQKTRAAASEADYKRNEQLISAIPGMPDLKVLIQSSDFNEGKLDSLLEHLIVKDLSSEKDKINAYRLAASFIRDTKKSFAEEFDKEAINNLMKKYNGIEEGPQYSEDQRSALRFYWNQASGYCTLQNEIAEVISTADKLMQNNKIREAQKRLTEKANTLDAEVFLYDRNELKRLSEAAQKSKSLLAISNIKRVQCN